MSDQEQVTFRLNKLVRDGVYDNMIELGQRPDVERLTGYKRLEALIEKIREESAELDPTDPRLKNEFVDLLEGLVEAADHVGLTLDLLIELMNEIREKRGGFSEGIYVRDLHLDADDEWVEYYRKDPDRFPEIG